MGLLPEHHGLWLGDIRTVLPNQILVLQDKLCHLYSALQIYCRIPPDHWDRLHYGPQRQYHCCPIKSSDRASTLSLGHCHSWLQCCVLTCWRIALSRSQFGQHRNTHCRLWHYVSSCRTIHGQCCRLLDVSLAGAFGFQCADCHLCQSDHNKSSLQLYRNLCCQLPRSSLPDQLQFHIEFIFNQLLFNHFAAGSSAYQLFFFHHSLWSLHREHLLQRNYNYLVLLSAQQSNPRQQRSDIRGRIRSNSSK